MRFKEVYLFVAATLYYSFAALFTFVMNDWFEFLIALPSALVFAMFTYHIDTAHKGGKVLKR